MARRMTLEGAKVLACVEIMPYSGGLTRNIVQCLEDYDIPLYLSHTIVDIKGKSRVEQVVVMEVDENRKPIPGTEIIFDCDTILLSVGLIPENELSKKAGIGLDQRTNGPVVYENMETSIPGIFACGNVVHVHDLVDFVTAESQRAGHAAARYVQSCKQGLEGAIEIKNGQGITYTVPQKIRVNEVGKSVDMFFRVNKVYKESTLLVHSGETLLTRFSRHHLAPGEMEHLVLPKKLIEQAQGEISVSIVEGR
jgi:pyruvate/2-oxoglutarate dehydrogenase complex dihydrolipoamide dehydrogenase (E3) component